MSEKVIVLPKEGTFPDQSRERLRHLSQILDSIIEIPGTRIQVGLDSIVGLIPGIGDAISAVISSYIVFEGARLGLPFHALIRMIFIVAIDALIGAIPILGDLFDITFKANLKNVALIEKYLDRGNLRQRTNQTAARTIQVIIALLLSAIFISIFLLLKWTFQAIAT